MGNILQDRRGPHRTGQFTPPRTPGKDTGDKCPEQCQKKDKECWNCFKESHFKLLPEV